MSGPATLGKAQPEGLQAPGAAVGNWSGVFAMSLCVFALIACEFMPVSLLTLIASDLNVSEGMAGQGMAVSGAFAVAASLLVAVITGRANRKTLLLGLTALMCVSCAVVALAPNFAVYMTGRAMVGIVIGGFWSMSAAMAMRLVPARDVPRALAIFNGGNALATVIAAPLGSYLGAVIGWRGAFLLLMPVALVAGLWQWASLPSMQAPASAARALPPHRLLAVPVVLLGMVAAGSFFMGQFTLFTYLRPFLETVTRVDVSTLALMLLTMGVAGFVGTSIIGAFIRRSLYATLVAIPVLMAAIAAALMALGHCTPAVFALLGLWGLLATAAPVGWWTWIASTMPDNAEAGGGLMVAVVQLSIALGSTAGGLLFDRSGYQSTFLLSALILLAAAASAFLTARSGHRR